jgi:hypothetical protein
MKLRSTTFVALLLSAAAASDTGVEGALGGAVDLAYSGQTASEKGGFRHAEVGPWPTTQLDLAPIKAQVWKAASTRCATAQSATSLQMGEANGFMEKMAGKAASAAVGKLLGGLLGGGGGGRKQQRPATSRDPIKKKHKSKFTDPGTNTRILLGGQAFSDGLLISTRVDKAKGKGTFHSIYLEQPDCRRYWPTNQMAYDLWGEWSLSVSVTKTTRKYENGNLVSESVDKSGFSKAGTFDFSDGFSIIGADGVSDELKLLLSPDEAYLNQLKSEIGSPMWQQMGFGEPAKGLRGVGAAFTVAPSALQPGTIAVVHITRIEAGQYRTVGFPFRMNFDGEGKMSFEQLTVPVSE